MGSIQKREIMNIVYRILRNTCFFVAGGLMVGHMVGWSIISVVVGGYFDIRVDDSQKPYL